MSRRNFRGPLSSARPRAAYGMCAASTATLALSEAIALPIILGAAALGLVAMRLGPNPRPWQTRGNLLNGLLLVGMLGCGATWFWHGSTLIALAYFATATLVLKLLDARPRTSEFLLVGLSLLQVVAASNLTDSALFPLCLAAYSSFTVWTLLAHTLACEAAEAGQPGAERAVLSAGLLRLTLLASLLTFALALIIFPLLPRMRAGVPLPGGGAALARSGFSDSVSLGDIGRIRQDNRVALRVDILRGETPAPEDAYWRGLAFDHFDGRTWSVSTGRQVAGDARVGLVLARDRREVTHQRIVREPTTAGVIFSAGPALGLRGPMGRIERDGNGSLYAQDSAARRVEYRIRSASLVPSADALRGDRAALPPEDNAERYRALPRLSPRVRELAAELTRDAATDYDRVAKLRDHLIETGRYTDAPPAHGRGDNPPIEDFLFRDTAGHCEYFASAMVLLARSAGLPSRLVTGFAGGRRNSLRGFIELSQADAHSWVEIHFATAGWVRFDPTPPDLRLAGSAALSAVNRLSELTSALELWWFRSFVDYDRERQIASFSWLARAVSPDDSGPLEPSAGKSPLQGGAAFWILAPLLVGIGALLWLRRGEPERAPLPFAYARALGMLRRVGLVRGATTTAREFVAESERSLTPEAAWAFRTITERYLAARFGGADEASLKRELAVLRLSLRRR